MSGPHEPKGELVRREVGEVLGRLSGESLDRSERGRLLARLTRLLAEGVRTAGARAALTGRYLTDALTEVAPHIQVRDLPALRRQHEDLAGDQLAEALVSEAARTTAAIGAAGGAVAAIAHAAPPAVILAPLHLAAETLAVVAVELKLVAELHVVYRRTPAGPSGQVAVAYLSSWADKRGLDVRDGAPSLGLVLGAAARQQLRTRLVRRLGRNVTTLAPFLAGALAGAELNRRETRSLGDKLVADLRR